MQKFIHDNEQYVLEVKRKHGKTKIDRELSEYMRKKNINNLQLFNNNGNNSMNNNNNFNYQLMNNPLLAMNYLLLQNQLLMIQKSQNLENATINDVIQQNNEKNNINKNQEDNNKEEKVENNENMKENDLEKNGGLENGNQEQNEVEGIKNVENDESKNNEIVKKLLEAINDQNNINNQERKIDHLNEK